MKKNIVAVIISALLLANCDTAVGPDSVSGPGSYNGVDSLAYSDTGPVISRLLGWQWAKEGSDFIWLFKNDGTVSVIHCCGEVYHRQFSYLFCGNVLITYGHETSFDEMEATLFTMTDDDASFTRANGTSFARGERDTSSLAVLPLVLSNGLLGTWQGDGDTQYEFHSGAELEISSASGSGRYGYLVRYAELLIFGPLVEETSVALEKYWFNKTGNKLYLRRSDGKKYTLNFLE
jgi:hypothetical protein